MPTNSNTFLSKLAPIGTFDDLTKEILSVLILKFMTDNTPRPIKTLR